MFTTKYLLDVLFFWMWLGMNVAVHADPLTVPKFQDHILKIWDIFEESDFFPNIFLAIMCVFLKLDAKKLPAVTWNNDGFSIGPSGINFSEFWIKIKLSIQESLNSYFL